MHRLSGLFIFPAGYRIWQAGYPIIEKAGYPAKYAAKEKHLNTAYNIFQSFDSMIMRGA